MRKEKTGKKRGGKFLGTVVDPKRFSRTQVKFYVILVPLALFMILPVIMIVVFALGVGAGSLVQSLIVSPDIFLCMIPR